jgi:uncharacterized membrane protein YfcA
MEMVGYLLLIGVGLSLGMLGGGGSVLSVPILIYLFSLDVVLASAYSLFIVGSTSLVGVVLKGRNHLVDVAASLRLGIPSMIATFVTRKWIVCTIPDVVMHIGGFHMSKRSLILFVFATLIIVSSLLMIRRKSPNKDSVQGGAHTFVVILAGLLIGLFSGFAGIGGGFLILPALVLLLGLQFSTAVGTTLLIITVNSLLGFTGDVMNQAIDWLFLFSITSLAVLGIFVGDTLNEFVSANQLKKSFGWVTIGAGVMILITEF